MMKYVKSVAIAALALMAAVAVSPPAYAKVDDRGQRTEKMSDSDAPTRQDVTSASTPVDGTPSIPVTVTTHYLHKNWQPWKNNEVYQIKTQGTAEYVARLDNWMFKDGVQGKLYRFTKGSNVGTETARTTVDIGTLNAVMSSSDRSQTNGVSAGQVSADNATRTINVSTRYWHAETYNDVTYTVDSSTNGTFVPEQNAHMVWVGSTLYKVDRGSDVMRSLADRPTVNIGVIDKRISSSDQVVSNDPTISTADSISIRGRSRTLNVGKDYINVETFQKKRYTIQHEETAEWVSEQNAHMAWISNRLYRVRINSDVVQLMQAKPTVNVGQRFYKIDYSDVLESVEVTPFSLTGDSKSVVVNVYRHYKNSETYQVKEYYISTTDIARYSDTYKVWTVIVDGRIYAIAFDGDVVSNSGDVIVIKAPGSMKRPDVIVVNPGGNPTDPPVVVPGKRPAPTTDTDPPVVVPGKKKPVDTDPPVVVPNKKKPPMVITDGDDDGPAIVVPRR